MYTDDRNAYRKMFFDTWAKHKKGLPLEALETQLVEILLAHPEYHSLLENPAQFMQQEFSLEENPFFHMSLHMSLREQLSTNRPNGIMEIYQSLCKKFNSQHDAEHAMITVLAQVMYQSQQSGQMPDEKVYLAKLKEL